MSVAALATALVVTFSAPTHTPAADAKWFYSVKATVAGKPVRATITSEIVDPFGSVHPVEYDGTHKNIVNRPFTGVFRDYVTWPAEALGFKLTFRVTVRAAGRMKVVTWWISAR